jgi:hypothetical protein
VIHSLDWPVRQALWLRVDHLTSLKEVRIAGEYAHLLFHATPLPWTTAVQIRVCSDGTSPGETKDDTEASDTQPWGYTPTRSSASRVVDGTVCQGKLCLHSRVLNAVLSTEGSPIHAKAFIFGGFHLSFPGLTTWNFATKIEANPKAFRSRRHSTTLQVPAITTGQGPSHLTPWAAPDILGYGNYIEAVIA